MRSRKAALNTLTALLLEAVEIVCAFILPRLILKHFGSAYNGITTSISNFLGYIALLKSGIGGVTRASLYKPLKNNDVVSISAIVNATEIFMRKIAMIILGFVFVLACVYPIFVREEFDWFFAFSLILILGINSFTQYFFGVTYQMLLKADQREYISSSVSIVTTILNTVVASALILLGFGIHVVKLGSVFVFCLNPIVIHYYVIKKYRINKSVPPDNRVISQRWYSFAHQLANFVHGNTDVVILTITSVLSEVSVYSVYMMFVSAVKKLINTLASGMEAAFGNIIAGGEKESLARNLSLLEFVIYTSTSICFSCAVVLIVPAVMVYTAGITDINYSRPVFGILICIAEMLFCVRTPYQTVVLAAGKYKETRNGAILEPIINIVVSIALVFKYGIVGVAIGTICAMAFRTFQYAIFMSKYIVVRPISVFWKRFLIFAANVTLNCLISSQVSYSHDTLGKLIILAMIRFAVVLGITTVFVVVFDLKNFKLLTEKIRSIFEIRKSKKKNNM